jgi:hypothetical protein
MSVELRPVGHDIWPGATLSVRQRNFLEQIKPFAHIEHSKLVKPVSCRRGAKFETKPKATGASSCASTIGIVLVLRVMRAPRE